MSLEREVALLESEVLDLTWKLENAETALADARETIRRGLALIDDYLRFNWHDRLKEGVALLDSVL